MAPRRVAECAEIFHGESKNEWRTLWNSEILGLFRVYERVLGYQRINFFDIFNLWSFVEIGRLYAIKIIIS